MHILINGAGISGLAAAITLAKQGIDITITEKRAQNGEVGAGLQLGPNAVAVLEQLGITSLLQKHITVPDRLSIANAASGNIITHFLLGHNIEQLYGFPYWVISRQDLHHALQKRASEEPKIKRIQPARLLEYEACENGFTAFVGQNISQRQALNVDAIIGADGIGSSLRHGLSPHHDIPHHENGLTPSSYIAWRRKTSLENLPDYFHNNHVHLLLGKGFHFVGYPIEGGKSYNNVLITKDHRTEKAFYENDFIPPMMHDELQQKLYPALCSDTPLAQLNAMKGEWQPWPLWGGGVLNRSHFAKKGAITLVGDAAHPVTPFLAQGAAFGLEDGYRLGMMVKDAIGQQHTQKNNTAMLSAIFRDYENKQIKRWQKLQKASLHQAKIYHLLSPFAEIRNLALTFFGHNLIQKRIDWIYSPCDLN